MNSENLNKLKTALMENKDLYLKWDNLKLLLRYDKSINNYRGLELEDKIQVGIWTKKMLLEIINGKREDMKLSIE